MVCTCICTMYIIQYVDVCCICCNLCVLAEVDKPGLKKQLSYRITASSLL